MENHKPNKKRKYVTSLIVGVSCIGLLLLLYGSIIHNSPITKNNGSLIFDGTLAENILSEGDSLLTIEYAYVKDNGEGKWPPHGPYGSIHAVVYSPEQLPEAPWKSDLELYRTMLYGPHQTIGNLFEWLDDEALIYTNYALYNWNLHTSNQIVLRFYESDPGPGREHDDLLMAVVDMQETLTHTITLQSDNVEIRIRTQDLHNIP